VSSKGEQFETGDVLPSDGGAKKRRGRTRHGSGGGDGVRNTRSGGAWAAVALAAVVGAALIDFIVQNTRSVRIEFFDVNWQMPVAVALLGSALAGALLVLAARVARTTQLRLAHRRGRKRQERVESFVNDPRS
jgi:uncharacterized integral membrane protein